MIFPQADFCQQSNKARGRSWRMKKLLGEPCEAQRSLGLITLVQMLDGASLVLWIGVGCECSGDEADRQSDDQGGWRCPWESLGEPASTPAARARKRIE